MRLFLGLPWPTEKIDDLTSRVRIWHNRPGLRPVKPENWHLTLRFVGEAPAEAVPVLTTILEEWGKNKGPMTFVDRGWACFGSYQKPKVVLLSLEPMPAVSKFIAALHKSLDGAGFVGDGRTWKPHVTVAYGQEGDPGPWPDEVKGGRPPVIFHRAVLYSSVLAPGGSDYQELASLELG